MKRIVISAAVVLAALLGPAATAAAAPNPNAGCVGQFSSFFAHSDEPHRSDVARDFAANSRPAGRNVYSHVAEFHGTLESCFDQT